MSYIGKRIADLAPKTARVLRTEVEPIMERETGRCRGRNGRQHQVGYTTTEFLDVNRDKIADIKRTTSKNSDGTRTSAPELQVLSEPDTHLNDNNDDGRIDEVEAWDNRDPAHSTFTHWTDENKDGKTDWYGYYVDEAGHDGPKVFVVEDTDFDGAYDTAEDDNWNKSPISPPIPISKYE